MARVTKVDAAWAAGFIDGEGHIGIHRIRDRRAGSIREFRLNPRIIVGQTHRQPLDRLVEIFGHSVHVRAERAARRTFYVWEVNGARGTAAVLAAVIPYLTLKRPEAEMVMTLCRRLELWGPGRRLTPDEVAARNEIAARLCDIKVMSRGALPVSA
jgi:hypothetical protein